ncbi:hypothetical protein BDR04DRAFT_1121298 [Suillus decipiens]|nr:hypothetical protein BDR04DRAFT_1121298 [Suillus decipiens]
MPYHVIHDTHNGVFPIYNRYKIRSRFSVAACHQIGWTFAVQFSTSTKINFGYSWDPQDNNMPLSIEFYYEDFEAQPNGLFRETSFSIHVESSRNADVKPGEFKFIRVEGAQILLEA